MMIAVICCMAEPGLCDFPLASQSSLFSCRLVHPSSSRIFTALLAACQSARSVCPCVFPLSAGEEVSGPTGWQVQEAQPSALVGFVPQGLEEG